MDLSIISVLGAKLAPYVAVLWCVDALLKTIAPLTPTPIDDNIADMLGKLLAKFFPKK
jgi:hypothetical protein